MKSYRLTSERWDDNLEPMGSDLILPARVCPECCMSWFYVAAADIPEQPTPELLKILMPYQNEFPDEYFAQMIEAADEENWEHPVWSAIELHDTVTPREFAVLAQKIRELLNLHPRRLILPRATVGPSRVRLQRPLKWDIMGGGAEVILLLSATAAEVLDDSDLSGFQIFPVSMEGKAPHPVYEMIVFGDGGLPITSPEGYWKQCEECKEWWLQKDQPYIFEIDSSVWDGSDFFHFAGKGYVYVSERAKEWLEASGLRLGIGFVEPQQDVCGYRAFLSKNALQTSP